jgi:hypothetical protein
MIVDFISIKGQLNNAANKFLKGEMDKRMPFLSQIRVVRQHEGKAASYQTVDQETKELDYELIGTGLSLTNEEIAAMSINDVIQLMLKVAEELASKSEKFAFQRMEEIISEAGNAIQESEGLSQESLLRVLETIEIDFDDTRDKPSLPQLVLHPDTARKLEERRSQMSEEEMADYEMRRQKILDEKYEQYVSRENNRKLVD